MRAGSSERFVICILVVTTGFQGCIFQFEFMNSFSEFGFFLVELFDFGVFSLQL